MNQRLRKLAMKVEKSDIECVDYLLALRPELKNLSSDANSTEILRNETLPCTHASL
jgi:hypothetical protein